MKAVLILSFLVLWVSPAWGNETYEKTIAGKSCDQRIDCTYKIGKDLEIEILVIGSPWSAITFSKSSINGDYYAQFGMQHFCVIIKPRNWELDSNIAFISPRTGKVYKDWVKCKADD